MILLLLGGLLAALGPGYLVWLHSGRRPARSVPPVATWPRVDIVVPLHDEAVLVEGKIRNLLDIEYPTDLMRVLLVDGASSDRTATIVAAGIRHDPRFRLLSESAANKTAQLNSALAEMRGQWVLVTDADARIPPGALSQMVRAALADDRVAVVGTRVEPAEAHPLERLHWSVFNRVRLDESLNGSASIVAGPCYLFKRNLIAEFPADVVADDVHVAFAAAARGYRVGYVDACVTELRSPTRLRALIGHKMRKADAYLREIVRFLPEIGSMSAPARGIFVWRAAQLVVMPIVCLIAAGFVVGWTIDGSGRSVAAALAGVAALVAASAVWRRWRPGAALPLVLPLGILLVGVLLVAIAVDPFSRQTACYPKVPAELPKTGG
jgi:cellulose synthase/poly-beta-1,6-N-acetylglucosamine synthase-like glycosyltransferase